ncbi:MAG: Uma2 family endonuclease [Acetobacteraceae bacterium]|nr:Uma2 family endonuclease [Acetobacteraceae bacterium]
MSASRNPLPPRAMTVQDFLAWDAPGPQQCQLVEGEPRAMAPASATLGALQSELARVLGNHLLARSSPCRAITAPGIVPRVQARTNFRIPDLGVTCASFAAEDQALSEPVLLIEILSPSNWAETWSNVWTYTSLPSVQEILVLRSDAVTADLIRRNADGTWPERPSTIEGDGELELESIGFRTPLLDLYRTTRLYG